MKILVVLPNLAVGGNQEVAVDLGRALVRRGHQVVVCSAGGPLEDRCRAGGLSLRVFPPPRAHPSARMVATVRQVAREERPDLVHSYGLWPLVETFYGAHLFGGVPMLVSMLSTEIDARRIPDTVPLVVGGRPARAEELRRQRTGPVWALRPPVDPDADHPDADGAPFRASLGIPGDAFLLVIVSRLEAVEKEAGIRATIQAVARLVASSADVRLVIVGAGAARPALERSARALDRPAAGPGSVVFTGELLDPRPALAAADVVLGRGVSALRGMAHGTPTIVLGAHRGATLVSSETVPHFERHGYLEGPPDSSTADLADLLAGLLADPAQRRRLGAVGREVAEGRSVDRVAGELESIYQEVLERGQPPVHRTVTGGLGLTLRLLARPVRGLTAAPRARWSPS